MIFLGLPSLFGQAFTTLELAKTIKWAIDSDITGLYHVTNNLSINKYNLLKLFQRYTEKEICIIPVEGKGVDKSFLDTRSGRTKI